MYPQRIPVSQASHQGGPSTRNRSQGSIRGMMVAHSAHEHRFSPFSIVVMYQNVKKVVFRNLGDMTMKKKVDTVL